MPGSSEGSGGVRSDARLQEDAGEQAGANDAHSGRPLAQEGCLGGSGRARIQERAGEQPSAHRANGLLLAHRACAAWAVAWEETRAGRARACRKTLVSRPARMARKPVKGSGRNTPDTVTASPGLAVRVSAPRRCTVRLRGVAPCGTCGQVRV